MTYCNALQHSATQCNTLHRTATRCNALQHVCMDFNHLDVQESYSNTLRHTATHCNTLQHAATCCNTQTYTWNSSILMRRNRTQTCFRNFLMKLQNSLTALCLALYSWHNLFSPPSFEILRSHHCPYPLPLSLSLALLTERSNRAYFQVST